MVHDLMALVVVKKEREALKYVVGAIVRFSFSKLLVPASVLVFILTMKMR